MFNDGGMLVQPSDDGSRPGYAKQKNIGSNQYGEFKTDKPTGFETINKKRLEDFNKKNKYINKLISDANAKDKYTSVGDIAEKVKKKFNLKNIKSINISSFPDLELLESRVDKVDKVLRDMLINDKPLNGFWHNIISDRTGVPINKPGNLRILDQSSTYNSIKDQGLDLLKVNYSRKTFNYLHDFSLSDQLTKALEIAEGNPTYKGLGGEKLRTALPSNKTMEFALRSWNANKGSKNGPIQFFDSNGKRIVWEKGIKLPYNKVSFSYNGKRHKKSNFNADYMKKYFPEIYENQTSLNKLSTKLIDNPYKPGSKISVKNLIKTIQINNFEWSPRTSTLDIMHGKNGIISEPFTNLTYASRDLNTLENSIKASLKAGNLKPSEANNLLKTVRSSIEGKTGDLLNDAIIERQKYLAKNKNLSFPLMNDKSFSKKLMAFCPAGTAKVTTKAGGGRVPYADGPVCTPDEAIRGMNEEFDKLKKGNATTGEASRTVNKFKNLGVKGMSGLLKAGLVSEVAFEAALGFDRVISEGQSPMQAFRQSYLTAPLRAIGAMKSFEEGEREEILDAARDKGKVGRVLDLQNLVGDKNKLASNIQGLKSNVEDLQRLDDGDFGYMGGTQGQEDALASAQANLQDMYRSGELSKAEQLFSTKPQDLKLKDKTLMDAYNDAIEKRRNIQAEKGSIAQSIAADENRIRKADNTMQNLYTQYSDKQLIDMLSNSKPLQEAEISPQEYLNMIAGTKRITPAVTSTMGGLDRLRTNLQEGEALARFADNFREEKAGGGISGLSGGDPKGAMTRSMNPDSQGLSYLFNRVKKV
jgi:hypothetical protein